MNRERELLDLADKMDNWDGIGTDAVSGWAERLRDIASQPVGLPELPLSQAVAVVYPDSGLRNDEQALALWRAAMYDTGGDPLFSADQLRDYATQGVGADAKDGLPFRIVPMVLPPGVVCVAYDPATGKVLAVLKDAISEQAVDNNGGQYNE